MTIANAVFPTFSTEKLRAEVERQGRKQTWLAEQTGYTPVNVSRFLTGRTPVTERFAVRAAIALDVSVESLLADTPEPASVPA